MKTKKILLMLLAVFCLAFCSAALADQEGNSYWCNSDQYGCWVTGEDGGQSYIMFWSESARDFFMGPGSKACVAKPYPAGKMPLDPPRIQDPNPAPVNPVNPEEELTTDKKVQAILTYLLDKTIVTEEQFNEAVKPAREKPDFEEAVNNVYNMIIEEWYKDDIIEAIEGLLGSDEQ